MTLKDVAFSGSREQVISEEAFRAIVEKAAVGILSLRETVEEGAGKEWSRHFVSRLIREVHVLRTLLNDHDAQENRTYSYLTEVVAGIRGFANVVYILKHLRERFLRSFLRNSTPRSEEFLEETRRTLAFCGDTLRNLFAALIDECVQLGIQLPPPANGDTEREAPDMAIRRHLPHNVDEEGIAGEEGKVAQVASSFLRLAELYDSVSPNGTPSYGELREYVRTKLGEEQARSLESFLHTIQSKYDTYIQFTSNEMRDPDLKQLRAVISLSLHLFEITTHLIHFYERHENDIRSERTKARIAAIVNKSAVLDRAVNFAFRSVGWPLGEGEKIAHRLIPDYTSIREKSFHVPDGVRLHIRPAALIAAIVNHHGTPVRMRMGDGECDASSITDVIFLAGTNIEVTEVTFRGDERPLRDLAVLFEIGLEEDGRLELETELGYLKRR